MKKSDMEGELLFRLIQRVCWSRHPDAKETEQELKDLWATDESLETKKYFGEFLVAGLEESSKCSALRPRRSRPKFVQDDGLQSVDIKEFFEHIRLTGRVTIGARANGDPVIVAVDAQVFEAALKGDQRALKLLINKFRRYRRKVVAS